MEGFERVMRDPCHPTSRKEGIINLGTAENKLMQEELMRKLKEALLVMILLLRNCCIMDVFMDLKL
jgi:hypothetical protein